MRLRWLLTFVLVMSLTPSLASARSAVRIGPHYKVGAVIDARDHTLVVAIVNAGTSPIEIPIRVLSVELSNVSTTRAFTFVEDREHAATQTVQIAAGDGVTKRIPLADRIAQLPPGDYDVRVRWHGHEARTTLTVLHHCGLVHRGALPTPPPLPSAPPKPPYVLASLAVLSLLVAMRFAKRAGTPDGCVPCSWA